ncbi:MAG: hypothetical protein ACYCUM_13655 [Solirubrobacteraceae bacterium]
MPKRSPRSIAQGFADHLNGVLNSTVTDARLSLLESAGEARRFTLGCLDGASPVAFKLHGSTARLLVLQDLRVVGEHCETLGYQYRFSRGAAKASWLLRWEYLRQPPDSAYPYPLAHVHVNGTLASGSTALAGLHVPTSRLPLELVLWHLIVEWGVMARREDWRHVLAESIDGFQRKRRSP